MAHGRGALPETVGYALKRLLLGRPLITAQLRSERLANPVALGVLSPDAISSSAYGTEEILLELLPFAGLAAFTLVLPITGVILLILVLVTASYRQVVMAYTRAGGSYVVARENFGPNVAQVAAAALLIDYVVTVAVQAAAGTVAVVSAVPLLGPYRQEITIGVVVLMCFVNLRGLREAGRPFAVPTYFFVFMVGSMIVAGAVRQFVTGLPRFDPTMLPGTVDVHAGNGLVMGASVFVVLRAFANGGSSLTGVEAISNTVSAFRSPRGRNARKVLTVMACILGFLVAGVSYLAFATHATPYQSGYPSVLAQEARAVFGSGSAGTVLFALLQAASALILYTGANTSFNGFPFLASFVAEDRFLPRQLTKRGHRLVFSNGIIVLTVLSVGLLLFTGGSVNSLVPFYAIGVFTGFAMAGYGMTRHHLRHRDPGWRRRLLINLSAGVAATVVVLIFAVAKFTEGAWLIVVVFPLLVFVLIRLNREYRAEAAILDEVREDQLRAPNYARHQLYVLVNSVDLAVLDALRYGRSLRGTDLKAVHIMVDAAHAEMLQRRWENLRINVPLQVIDCPDRRVARAVANLVLDTTAEEGTHVTVLLPRRIYPLLLGRLLHGRTGDSIARVISRIPRAAATIVPFDVSAQLRQKFPELPEGRVTGAIERVAERIAEQEPADVVQYDQPVPGGAAVPVASLRPGRHATIEGRLREVTEQARDGRQILSGTLSDNSGAVAVELPRTRGRPPEPGTLLRVHGRVVEPADGDMLTIVDARYTVVSEDD